MTRDSCTRNQLPSRIETPETRHLHLFTRRSNRCGCPVSLRWNRSLRLRMKSMFQLLCSILATGFSTTSFRAFLSNAWCSLSSFQLLNLSASVTTANIKTISPTTYHEYRRILAVLSLSNRSRRDLIDGFSHGFQIGVHHAKYGALKESRCSNADC